MPQLCPEALEPPSEFSWATALLRTLHGCTGIRMGPVHSGHLNTSIKRTRRDSEIRKATETSVTHSVTACEVPAKDPLEILVRIRTFK